MDTNRDGKIDFNEFVDALWRWHIYKDNKPLLELGNKKQNVTQISNTPSLNSNEKNNTVKSMQTEET